MFRIFTLLLLVSFMSSCSEEQDVRLNQLEEKFSIQLQLINIEYARHHLDYGVVYIKLRNSPGNEFWSSLESHGWEKDADSSTISYSREGYRLEYINAEQLIVIEPPLKVTPRTSHAAKETTALEPRGANCYNAP